MNFINNLNIRSKLILLFILLLIPLVYFIKKNIAERIATEKKIRRIYSQVEYAEKLSSILSEVQNERGLTIAYFASDKTNFLTELIVQKGETNALFAKIHSISQKVSPIIITDLKKEIVKVRELAMRPNVNPDSVYNRYTFLIKGLIREIARLTKGVPDPEIKAQLNSYMNLVYASDFWGKQEN